MPDFEHRPVMLDEIVEHLSAAPAGLLVDATVGGGGHSRALLAAHEGLNLLGLDRDEQALIAAHEALAPFGDRVQLRQVPFSELGAAVASVGFSELSAVLFDLGVSSPQLDRAERGFSYRFDGPLDMRMDRRQKLSADDVVNHYPQDRLVGVLRRYGDERFARRIGAAIVAQRDIPGTAELAEVVRTAIPAAARRRGGHPAKRTFQAIRLEVNSELTELEAALRQCLDMLAPSARGALLTYHSGEDRIAKRLLRQAAGLGPTSVPAGLPVKYRPEDLAAIRLVPRSARTPGQSELEANRRSSSARLRTFVAADEQVAA